MTTSRHPSHAGFTLVELLVGMSLALVVMTGVLSTFSFLGRNLTRLANQQKLETQARRALQYFAQDVRTGTGLSNIMVSGTLAAPPKLRSFRITIQTSTGTTFVDYSYSSATQTLVRTPATGPSVNLLTNLLDFEFSYYNASDTAITSDFANKTPTIKKVAMDFASQTAQTNLIHDDTRSPVFHGTSARVSMRNKTWSD